MDTFFIDAYREEVLRCLSEILKKDIAELNSIVERPPERVLGDFAFPCFLLAREMKTDPAKIAESLVEGARRILRSDLIESVEAKQGYLNFFINKKRYYKDVLKSVLEEGNNVGLAQVGKGQTVVIDFSSPNIAKPFQISHLRSTNLGNALSKLYKALGYQVVRINHVGDWGTSFGKMIAAYKKWGTADFVKGGPVDNLYKLYVRFHQEQDEQLLEEAKAWSNKLEHGDEEALELWEWFRELSLQEFKRIYQILRVSFDYILGESFYNKLMKGTIERLKKLKLLKKSENAYIVDLEAYNMSPCMIQKSDGTTLYATRDIAAAEYRAKTFSFSKMLYLVGSEQMLHFKQVFKVLELMGYEWAKSCFHVPFGLIKFGDEKMSSRKGNVVLLDDVLQKAIALAEEIVRKKDVEREGQERFSDKEIQSIAREVGIGAVIFGDLKNGRMKDVSFSWSEILNFDGETGPYLQYTSARLTSLLNKAGVNDLQAVGKCEGGECFEIAEEVDLMHDIADFAPVVRDAVTLNEPSEVSRYALRLAKSFNRLYYNHRILQAPEANRLRRLRLCLATREILNQSLSLLGIMPLEKM